MWLQYISLVHTPVSSMKDQWHLPQNVWGDKTFVAKYDDVIFILSFGKNVSQNHYINKPRLYDNPTKHTYLSHDWIYLYSKSKADAHFSIFAWPIQHTRGIWNYLPFYALLCLHNALIMVHVLYVFNCYGKLLESDGGVIECLINLSWQQDLYLFRIVGSTPQRPHYPRVT